jgi:hypothetical protein
MTDGISPRDLTKTLRLPCGVVSERRIPGGAPAVLVEDQDALTRAEDDGRFWRYVPEKWEPDKKAIGKALAAGEQVPGCRLAEKQEVWAITIEGDL